MQTLGIVASEVALNSARPHLQIAGVFGRNYHFIPTTTTCQPFADPLLRLLVLIGIRTSKSQLQLDQVSLTPIKFTYVSIKLPP